MKLTKRILSKIERFPKSFYNFNKGVEINETEIKEWLVECVKSASPNTCFSYRASGNTLVIAFVLGPCEKTKYYDLELIVCKNYQTTTIFDLDLDNVALLNKPKHFFEI